MPGFIGRSYRDYSGEVSSFELTTYAITGANFANHEAHQAALDSAIAGITQGELAKTAFGMRVTESNDNGPFGANRELKYLVTYRANSSEKLFRVELPCVQEIEANYKPNTDELDLTATLVAAFVDAFEDIVRSPDNGTEACTVMSIRLVGRNI